MDDKISILIIFILKNKFINMQILGFEITNTQLYLMGGIGVSTRLLASMFRGNKGKKENSRVIELDKNNVTPAKLISRENLDSVSSLLLDDVELFCGTSSDQVSLLYVQDGNTYIINGRFVNFSNSSWRFISEKIYVVENGELDEIKNNGKVQSVAFKTNCYYKKNSAGNFVLAGVATGVTGADLNGDGKSNFTDIVLGSLVGGVAINSLTNDSNTKGGIILKKNSRIELYID